MTFSAVSNRVVAVVLAALLAPLAHAADQPGPTATPTAEQKKAAEQEALKRDYAELVRTHAAERARLTPDVQAAVKKIADEKYPDGKSAISAALAGPQRAPANVARDAQRHPLETLTFFGFAPDQKVLEYGPGEGWYTEILAPALAAQGKLYVTTPDPNGPKDQRPTLYAVRTKLFLERVPEVYGKVEPVVIDGKSPKLPFDSELDLIIVMRGLHGMYNNGTLDAWLAAFHRALEPGGVLGIEQHRADPSKTAEQTSKQGYLPEAFVIEQIEKAGFKLDGKSEINANPKDDRDHPEGVWSLPPTLRGSEEDRAKYAAIGESDRMTLKFVKPAAN